MHADLVSQSLVDTVSESSNIRSLLSLDSVTNYPSTPIPSDGGNLGSCLNQILRLIKIRDERGVNLDLFSCRESAGFDQHFDGKGSLEDLLKKLNNPLGEFRQELINEGLWDNVVVIMVSEFARTISPNNNGGSDHAWGG